MKMISISLVLASALGAAHAAPDPFVAGNTAASAGDHAAAAAAFERAIAMHGWSPGTLLDLGNAYASAGQQGRAILAYERARVIAPRDAAISGNLARARELAGVSVRRPSRIDAAVATLTADEWTWIAIAACILAAAGLVGHAWGFRRSWSRTLAITGALAVVASSAAAIRAAPASDLAIVVASDTARIAPFAAAEAAFTAPEGTRVRIERERGDFYYVREGELTGWLPRGAVEPVVAQRSASGA